MYYLSAAKYQKQQKVENARIEIGLLQTIMIVFTVILGFFLPVSLIEYYRTNPQELATYTARVAGVNSEIQQATDLQILLNQPENLTRIGYTFIILSLAICVFLLTKLIFTPAKISKPLYGNNHRDLA